MRDLSLCRRHFEAECQRLEALDERFQNVTDLVQENKYTEAADAVAALLRENLYDVRLLGYYLYAAVHEDGLVRMGEVLGTLAVTIAQNWATLPEGDKRAVMLNKSLNWLFQKLLDTLKYHQTKKDERWTGWMSALTEEHATTAVQKAQDLLVLLSDPRHHAVAELLSQLAQWLRDIKALLTAAARAQEAQQPKPAEQPRPAEPVRVAEAAPGVVAVAMPQLPAAAASTFMQLGQVVQLRGSAQFVELCNKLKAFELLVQRKEFAKAALVSDDILAALDSFDPRRYFPELFANFGSLLNKHVADIQEHWDRKDTTEWKMLSQFYQVDLESFVGRK
jgi:hypothetical protein